MMASSIFLRNHRKLQRDALFFFFLLLNSIDIYNTFQYSFVVSTTTMHIWFSWSPFLVGHACWLIHIEELCSQHKRGICGWFEVDILQSRISIQCVKDNILWSSRPHAYWSLAYYRVVSLKIIRTILSYIIKVKKNVMKISEIILNIK